MACWKLASQVGASFHRLKTVATLIAFAWAAQVALHTGVRLSGTCGQQTSVNASCRFLAQAVSESRETGVWQMSLSTTLRVEAVTGSSGLEVHFQGKNKLENVPLVREEPETLRPLTMEFSTALAIAVAMSPLLGIA